MFGTAAAAVGLLVTGTSVTARAAALMSYTAQGTVSNSNAPVPADAAAAPGEDQAFILDPVTQASASAQPYESTDGSGNSYIEVVVSPETNYFLEDPSTGAWNKSTYSQTVVQGATLQVQGHFQNNPDGTTTFFATYVWNPPEPPPTNSGGGGPGPAACGASLTSHLKPFLLSGTIVNNRWSLPCEPASSEPFGFAVGSPTSPDTVPDAFTAGGGYAQIAYTPATIFEWEGHVSNYATAVYPGNLAEVWGEYVNTAQSGWLFVTKLVYAYPTGWTAPTPQAASYQLDTDIAASAAVTTSGSYSGKSYYNPSNPDSNQSYYNDNLNYSASWSCSLDSNGTDTDVTGTWQLSDTSNDTISGSFAGTVSSAGAIDFGMDVTSGTNVFNTANGGGKMTGTAYPNASSPGYVPGMCPTSLTSTIYLSYVTNS